MSMGYILLLVIYFITHVDIFLMRRFHNAYKFQINPTFANLIFILLI